MSEDSSKMRHKHKKAKTIYHSRWAEQDSKIHPGSYASPEHRDFCGYQLPSDLQAAMDAARAENGDKSPTDEEPNSNRPSASKKRVALLLGYLGSGYAGFQINKEQKTLQAELELALFTAGLLSANNFGTPHKYGWSTSGRTDKGVHACAQVCSAKLTTDDDMDRVREIINQQLPEQIRVLDAVRTTRNFCAKTQRDRVRYQYMIPSFVLYDPVDLKRLFFEVCGKDLAERPLTDGLTDQELAAMQNRLYSFRSTPKHLADLRAALDSYVGTYSFHNFTKGVKPNQAQASRNIYSFQAEEPVIFDNGVEWIPTQVVGQSFLLHQIRKMVSVAMDVARGAAPVSTIPLALDKTNDWRLNVAPAQGLFLEMSYYTGYNRRKASNAELSDIDWDNVKNPAHARWKDFRRNVVMNHIVEEEAKDGNFVQYLYTQEFRYDYRTYYHLDATSDVNEEKDES